MSLDYFKHIGIPIGLNIIQRHSKARDLQPRQQLSQIGGQKSVHYTPPVKITFQTQTPQLLPSYLDTSLNPADD